MVVGSRGANISAQARVFRFLSLFLVVVLVALAIEGLVATFKARENPVQLMYAASMLVAVGVLLAAWVVFIHFNRSAEELQPEVIVDAKRKDNKVN